MELPLPRWVEFAVVAVLIVILPFALRIIDSFHKQPESSKIQ